MSELEFTSEAFDISNPNPWQALGLDQSTFLDEKAKEALMRNNATRSRRILLPIMRPFARLAIILFRFIRLFIPERFTSPKLLHKTIVWGMRTFVSADANYLILRHFNMGSQVLKFLIVNLTKGTLSSHPLYPKKIEDLGDNMFVQHDLNIYNLVGEYGGYLKDTGQSIDAIPIEEIDFSMIEDFDDEIAEMPNKWTNFIDLQTAIELYTPMFALLLSREDFERASNSLQLDETIAIYVASLFDQKEIVGLVNNKHPMVPLSTIEAGFRLMLHGIDAENLYGFIKYVRDQV